MSGKKYNTTGAMSTGKPSVLVPFVYVAGCAIRAAAAVYSRAKDGYWVTFMDGTRSWHTVDEVGFQRVLVFPEDELEWPES